MWFPTIIWRTASWISFKFGHNVYNASKVLMLLIHWTVAFGGDAAISDALLFYTNTEKRYTMTCHMAIYSIFQIIYQLGARSNRDLITMNTLFYGVTILLSSFCTNFSNTKQYI